MIISKKVLIALSIMICLTLLIIWGDNNRNLDLCDQEWLNLLKEDFWYLQNNKASKIIADPKTWDCLLFNNNWKLIFEIDPIWIKNKKDGILNQRKKEEEIEK